MSQTPRASQLGAIIVLSLGVVQGCAMFQGPRESTTERTTRRDNTGKGAGIGAAAGAILGAVLGEGEADEILAGAAIGAGIGAGVGAYMDRQEEKLAQIPGTTVERAGKDLLLIHFDADLLFAVDSASVNSSSQDTLEDVSRVLVDFPKTAVVVQGHTDGTGSESHNQALSERRARAVLQYLAGRGVDASRMTALGYGEDQPVASNFTESGRRLNRRVNILLKAKAT